MDFRSGINLYPDLRLTNNSAREYSASLRRIEGIADKLAAMQQAAANTTARTRRLQASIILAGNRVPENYDSLAQVKTDLVSAVASVAAYCSGLQANVSVLLAPRWIAPDDSVADALSIVRAVAVAGGVPVRLAINTGMLLAQGVNSSIALAASVPGLTPADVGMWLAADFVADPLTASPMSVHAPLSAPGGALAAAAVCSIVSFCREAPLIIDAGLPSQEVPLGAGGQRHTAQDREYLEVTLLQRCRSPAV